MKNISRLLAILLFVTVGSCSKVPERPKNVSNSNRESIQIGDTIDAEHFRVFETTDTVLSFQKNGKITKVIVPKRSTNQFTDFQEFLDRCSADSLSYDDLELTDVTGDGYDDSCITRIHFRFQLPFIEHIVFTQGRRIFYDTLLLEDGVAAMEYFGEDESAYLALKPYSSLYVAEHGFGSFVGDRVSGNLNIADQFLNGTHPNEKSYWINYIQNYKGHWIWNLAVISPSGLIWDSRSKEFIIYWGP